MEILIVIAPMLIIGVIGYVIISIQDWITDMRFYRRQTRKELDRIKVPFAKVDCALPTGEIETLGPGKVLIFDKQKTGIVTSLHSNDEEMEVMLDEAEKLIKEARDRTVN